jgi:hypothetical protein
VNAIKLKPCPFCGGPAALWAQTPIADWKGEHATWVVRCEMPDKGGCGITTQGHKSNLVVEDQWNRRTP